MEKSIMNGDILISGSDVMVLLFHGFTGTPSELEYVGREINRREGWSVFIPCLPGHCTSPYDLEKIRQDDWIKGAEKHFLELREQYRTVFVGGLSMGGLIALKLAMKYRSIPAIVTIASPMKLKNKFDDMLLKTFAMLDLEIPFHHRKNGRDIHFPPPTFQFVDYKWFPLSAAVELYKLILHVRFGLNQVSNPILVLHSLSDNTAHPESAKIIYGRVSSKIKEIFYFQDSYHVIPLDVDRECLTKKMIEFFSQFI